MDPLEIKGSTNDGTITFSYKASLRNLNFVLGT